MQPIAARATNTYALGIAVTAGAALSISLNSIAVIQVYAHGGNAQTVVLLRYVFFILAFVAIAGLLGKPLGFGRGHLLHAFGSGAVAGAGSMGLLGSYSFIPISLTIVLVYTYPILTALMMAVLQRRRPSAIQLLCLMVALAGVALTIGIDRVVLDPRGLALAALASFGFAGAIAWNAVALRAADASLTSFYMALSGTAVVAITVVATGTYVPPSGSPFGSLSGTLAGWLAMLASSICFSLAFLGMYRGVQMIGGTPAAMVMNLEPVLTVVLAAVLLGERLTQQHLIGGLMVIGAVIGSQIMEVRKVKEA